MRTPVDPRIIASDPATGRPGVRAASRRAVCEFRPPALRSRGAGRCCSPWPGRATCRARSAPCSRAPRSIVPKTVRPCTRRCAANLSDSTGARGAHQQALAARARMAESGRAAGSVRRDRCRSTSASAARTSAHALPRSLAGFRQRSLPLAFPQQCRRPSDRAAGGRAGPQQDRGRAGVEELRDAGNPTQRRAC